MWQVDAVAVKPKMHRRDRRADERFIGRRHEIGHDPRCLTPRQGDDHGVAGRAACGMNHGSGPTSRVAFDRRHAPARLHRHATALQPRHEPIAEEAAERFGGHEHIGGVAMGEKGIDRHLPRRSGAYEID